jgi:hypothetical protein
MAFQIPIGRVENLPDPIEVRVPRLLRLSEAGGKPYCRQGHYAADKSHFLIY